ncbi:MAG: WYL domain-containing protein [Actinomycetota bacterium]|nr:hypothetical protein [Acidobacteriota bacterium]MEC9000472.1 WYL domain-containing protein [Actinomycetota bacterium]MED5220004.1 WYL domain-containing protein [Actinomycetota bacterium]MED5232924.1 WYL domain-containing protein [Actinomycetota bacterium]
MAEQAKWERLAKLVAVLMDAPYPLTQVEVMDRLPAGTYPAKDSESVRRMFERDKDDLRATGILVRTAVSPNFDVDGYIIDREDFGTDLPAFDREESAAVALVLTAMGSSVRLWEVGGDASADPGTSLIPSAGIGDNEDVRALLLAVTDSATVRFTYRDAGSDLVEARVVEPHLIAYVKGHWHLSGHDLGRNGGRQFRADRIAAGSVARTGDRFDPPERPRPISADHFWRMGSGSSTDVELLVDARHAAWVEQFLGSHTVADRRSDGSVVVVEEVKNLGAFRGFVLSLLDGAEVIGPPEVRDAMVAWLALLAGEGEDV